MHEPAGRLRRGERRSVPDGVRRRGAGREKPPAEHGNFGVSFENSCGEPKIGHGVPFEGFGALGGGGSVCK